VLLIKEKGVKKESMKSKLKNDNVRSKQLVSLLFVIGLILVVVGVSYAAYVFTGTGTTENVITTGNLEISFAEQNNILIKDRYPETDTEGLANTDTNSQMTFTVSSNIVGTATVNYAVGLVEIEEDTTLTQDYIKINLTKNGSAATGFTSDAGKTIKSFQNETFGELLTSHVITKGSITGTNVDTYNLKAWISEEYNLPTTDTSSGNSHSVATTSEEFSFKIKVVGTDATQNEEEPNIPNAPELATNMIPVTYDSENDTWVKADSTNANDAWYNYDNKVWANAVTVTSTNRQTYLDATPGTPISMDDINTMWVWIPRFSATTNTLDCSTLVNPTAEEYPQCYQNLSDTDKQKAVAAIQQFGLSDPEGVLERLLNGELVEFGGMVGDLSQVVAYYNTNAAPDSISIIYDELVSDRVITGANGGTQSNPGAFNIDFATTNESAHDAFTFGNNEYAGIWVAKFESSHPTLSEKDADNSLGCINEICENAKGIEILPNKVSLRLNNVSNFFYAGRSLEQAENLYGLVSNEIDTHMMKNSEWGAVAYLTQSIYGRCASQLECKEIGINNNSSYVTGYGAPAGSDYQENDDEYPYIAPQPYNTNQGMDASTTGNIYGVYDMSGGAFEYVMAFYTDGTNYYINGSGFNGCSNSDCSSKVEDGLSIPNANYYNVYTTSTNYTSAGLQHALTETYFWYGNGSIFVSSEYPWFGRGGYFGYPESAGVFASTRTSDGNGYYGGFRAALVK